MWKFENFFLISSARQQLRYLMLKFVTKNIHQNTHGPDLIGPFSCCIYAKIAETDDAVT